METDVQHPLEGPTPFGEPKGWYGKDGRLCGSERPAPGRSTMVGMGADGRNPMEAPQPHGRRACGAMNGSGPAGCGLDGQKLAPEKRRPLRREGASLAGLGQARELPGQACQDGRQDDRVPQVTRSPPKAPGSVLRKPVRPGGRSGGGPGPLEDRPL
jgi:hypothetical protein